jgi:N-acylglucosamine 2-epimerase
MDPATLLDRKKGYERLLFDDVMPFWLAHGVDRENGGFFTGLAADGELIESDKSVWFQGRMSWTFATLYADYRQNPAYLEAARLGIQFLEKACTDTDGKMFFRVTRDGRPLIKRKRYFFSEAFAIIGLAAYSRATGDPAPLARARTILEQVDRYRSNPDLLEAKWNPQERPMRAFADPMIMLATVQELRRADPNHAREYDHRAARLISEMRQFVRDDLECVLETVGPSAEFLDHFEGRLLNPGHAIEGSWFVMQEARRGNDAGLLRLGLQMLDWMWLWGWDKEYGGIIYYRDALSRPAAEYWHDMKFWWPQCEAIIATLMAYVGTGDERYARCFEDIDRYAHANFVDSDHGEWYGYLHRDGRLSTTLKGNLYKGAFHVPRMYMHAITLLDELRQQEASR